MIFELRS